MDIFKALKKENSFLKRFYITMSCIAILLPFVLLLSGLRNTFYLSYLIFIEVLILLAIINKYNYHYLKFKYNNNKLKFKSGLFSKESLILCDKVSIVHTEKMEEDMDIIIITTVNFKNKSLKPITRGFLKRFPLVSKIYRKQKELYPENTFYYQVIRKGGLKKYQLLDLIYKNCVKADYTEEGILNIKIARGQTL